MSDQQVRMIAARPWDPDEYPPLKRALWNKVLRNYISDGSIGPIIYPGSIEGNCEYCGIRIAIGPRQQKVLRRDSRFLTFCMICAVVASEEADAEMDVVQLGNPDDPNAGRL